MNRSDKNRIYGLLPSIYRLQDLSQQTSDGHRPLQDLTALMEETLKILENDLEGLYENWFIETCDEWVAPYIGDLVDADLLRSVKGNATLSGKAYVANTMHYRKRKGTVAILEEIARDVTGWDAHVVEFFHLMSTTQNINHTRLENQCTPNIIDPELMGHVGGAFDTIPHTLDVRRIKSGHGYYNVANVGVFLWRLTAYPVRRARAFYHGKGRYSFNSIGEDMQLFNHPSDQYDDILSKEVNVSVPIRREAAKKYLPLYYGENRSILIEEKTASDLQEIKKTKIVICDLSDIDKAGNWNRPVNFVNLDPSSVAIDPVLGRILFLDELEETMSVDELDRTIPKHDVFVSYYYGFSADMGGGFYKRDLYESETSNMEIYSISVGAPKGVDGSYSSIVAAIDAALKRWETAKDFPDMPSPDVIILEIVDSEIYGEAISGIIIPAGKTLILRSEQEKRATLTATKENIIQVSGDGLGSCFVLDGLLLNKNIQLKVVVNTSNTNGLTKLIIQNCSLVPPEDDKCSIVVEGNNYLTAILNKSISGKISMNQPSRSQLVLKDSIVDKGSDVCAVDCFEASIENSTILGKSNFEILTFASNVIFTDTVRVKRRQEGGVRFSYIAHRFEKDGSPSRVPRCYHCQPSETDMGIVPRFTSEKYGSPGYAQLHRCIVKEISAGADNDSEMGAFNQVYQSHRINNLLAIFAEYLPFRLEAGVILVT
ncbi:hypothetical protein [Candidatus Bathycorpusculum sp.]|uniref:hypothetical protein n=1 Tax=Candidatus Bathycorpusculum sp. TaxID=2994959 RepID=UPI002827A96C|nr:hypothetical protein [Candidatus Termitimicrobium sp.]MCL2686220.1 hypothetical protein [Candidatus Termitimicrobium sp.]